MLHIYWFEDIFQACKSWYRVLKSNGRLLLCYSHPLTECLHNDEGKISIVRNYFDISPEYYKFKGTPLANKHGGWNKDGRGDWRGYCQPGQYHVPWAA